MAGGAGEGRWVVDVHAWGEEEDSLDGVGREGSGRGGVDEGHCICGFCGWCWRDVFVGMSWLAVDWHC